MGAMKNFIYFLIILFVCACTSVKKPFVTEYDNIMFNEYENVYTQCQFDSICNVDTLDNNLGTWIMLPLRDYETKENVTQYMFIRSLGENECIYRVQKINDNTYKITKRITK